MGKFDKERLGPAPRSVVNPALLAHQYDSVDTPTTDSFGRTNPTREDLRKLGERIQAIREGRSLNERTLAQAHKPRYRQKVVFEPGSLEEARALRQLEAKQNRRRGKKNRSYSY